MEIDFDVLQAIFWSITYVLLIVYSIKNKKHGISLVSIVLNISWETIALLYDIVNQFSSWIHIFWFSLDLVILFFGN